MSDLPKGWSKASLSEFCTKIVDGSHNPPAGHPTGRPMLSARNVQNNALDLSEFRRLKEEDFIREDGRTRVSAGDVLLTIVGTIGRSYAVQEYDEPFVLQRSVAVLRPLLVSPRYCAYQFQSPALQDELRSRARGTAQKGVYLKTLSALELAIAPLPEQSRIVAEIEKQFTRLDAATVALKRVQTNLKRHRASVLKAACEGRLVPIEAELARKEDREYEPAEKLLQRMLHERRLRWEADTLAKLIVAGKTPKDDSWKRKYKEPSAPDTTDLPRLPAGWLWASLGQLAWSVKDGPHYSPKYQDSGIPFITGGQIRPSGVDFSSAKFISPELHEELSKRCHPEKGDILMTKGGTTGIARVNTYDTVFSVWVHVAVLKLVDSVDEFYVQHCLNSPFGYAQSQRFTHGVGNQDLGLTRMIDILLPIPPLIEQRRIATEVERQFGTMDRLECILERQIARLNPLRSSILSKAFSGSLVPRDPNDEPASIVLDRIRRERALSTITQRTDERFRTDEITPETPDAFDDVG